MGADRGASRPDVELLPPGIVERRVRLRMFLGPDAAEEWEVEGVGREDSNCLRMREPKPAMISCGFDCRSFSFSVGSFGFDVDLNDGIDGRWSVPVVLLID